MPGGWADALGLHSLGLFALSVLVLNATPGVDMLFTLRCTLQAGWRAGLAAAGGIVAGCAVHALAAAFGLAALLALWGWAFTALKWAGAAYLLWLGWGLLREAWRGPPPAGPEGPAAAPPALAGLFRQGLLTNVLNPKVALFFLAFLPQFIHPQAGQQTLAFLVLGAWMVAQGALFLVALVGLAALLRRGGASPRVTRGLQWLGGLLFVGLALRLLRSNPEVSA